MTKSELIEKIASNQDQLPSTRCGIGRKNDP